MSDENSPPPSYEECTKATEEVYHQGAHWAAANPSSRPVHLDLATCVTTCWIELEPHPLGFYPAGGSVRGTVTISTKKTIRLRGVYLKVKCKTSAIWDTTGDAETWELNRSRNYKLVTTKQAADGDTEFGVSGVRLLKSDQILKPGQHTFPFSFVLSDSIPSSFQEDHGHVKYTIKAVIMRSWNKANDRCKVPFLVKSNKSFLPPKIQELVPLYSGKTEDFHISEVQVDNRKYTPGSSILFSAKIQRLKGNSYCYFLIKLIQRITYAAAKTVTVEKTICEHKAELFRNLKTRLLDKYPIPIPLDLEPTGYPFCHLIDCNYVIKLLAFDGARESSMPCQRFEHPGNFRELVQLPIIISSCSNQ